MIGLYESGELDVTTVEIFLHLVSLLGNKCFVCT